MRVEINRISGDIYVNGSKIVFAVDFAPGDHLKYDSVDWILGWAKIGLMSRGHDVPHFEVKTIAQHEQLANISPTDKEAETPASPKLGS